MKTLAIILLLSMLAVALQAQDPDSLGYRTGDNKLLLSSNANVLPEHTSTFGIQYFFVLDYTMNLFSVLEAGVGCPFPFSNEFAEYFTLHTKYQVYRMDNNRIKVALEARGVPAFGVGSIGAPVSLYQKQFGLHFTPLCTYADDDFTAGVNIGMTVNVGEKHQLIYEFANADLYNNNDVLDNDKEEKLQGITAMGWRKNGKNICWELGLIHPDTDDGDWVAFPYISCSWTWGE